MRYTNPGEVVSLESNRVEIRDKPRLKSRSVILALTGMLAGVYALGTIALGVVAFGALNLRFTNVLIGLVPIFGWAGVFGISLGVLLANTTSILGPIDLLSAIFSLFALAILHLLRKRSVIAGLAIYDITLSLWVSFEISFETGAPYLPTLYIVSAGMSLILALAYILYRALILAGLKKRVEGILG